MPTRNRSYAFCADYNELSACLFSIQALEDNGNLDAEASRLLGLFKNDILRKLYLRVINVLGLIDGVTEVLENTGSGANAILHPSDFDAADFSNLDFWVGYKDDTNDGYSSEFRTVLNILQAFCSRSTEISEEGKTAIDEALIPVLEALEEIKDYLFRMGLNPCADPDERFKNNSPGVYLQVSGSDGTDGVAEGLHLRWSLSGELGTNHMPKGTYNNTNGSTIGFNKPDDFAQVSRTLYVNPAIMDVDFELDKPVVNNSKRVWTYVINKMINGQRISNRLKLSFADKIKYNRLAQIMSPTMSYFQFLNSYTGVIKLEILNKTAFKVALGFQNASSSVVANLKMEAACQSSSTREASEPVNVRKTVVLQHSATDQVEIMGENIRTLGFRKSATGVFKTFSFETYHDFLTTRSSTDWTPVGNGFSLSLNDAEVMNRLESAAYPIDNKWPHYNNGSRVRIANYKAKWDSSVPNEPGIRDAVMRYLQLSELDPRAVDNLKDDQTGVDMPELSVSYLDILNLQGMDYHMARMLGLGHIDTPSNAGLNDQFIYRLEYTNRKGLNSTEMMDYTYTSLPVKKSDGRLPEKPIMREVNYGLPVVDTELDNSFDQQGYTSLDNVRAVNIGRMPFSDEIPAHDFFADLSSIENENIFENPKPVQYGIEYRAENQQSYIKPEITHEKAIGTSFYSFDDEFPSKGVLETVAVPDDPTSLYIHFERKSGVHFYAIYGVNWFSRASVVSDEVATDVTKIPVRNSLVPPTDVTVQYIQKESQLLFTTAVEQSWLKDQSNTFPDQDINFTRTTFNWIDIVDVSFLEETSVEELSTVVRPDKIKAHFKQGLPMEVIGMIKSIRPVKGSETLLQLFSGSYKLIEGTVIKPFVASQDLFRFKDCILSTPAGQFRVVQVEYAALGPIITIEKAYDLDLVNDEEDPGTYASQKNYTSPELNSRFSMVENLSNQDNWEPVIEDISLVSFANPGQPNIESSVDSEGNVCKYWIGGLHCAAKVVPLFSEGGSPDDLPGYYMISCEESLPAHPQTNLPFDPQNPQKNAPDTLNTTHVEWYKGHIRIPQVKEGLEMKVLEVAFVEQTHPLILYVRDTSYQEAPIMHSRNEDEQVNINYHPGYRAYIFPEQAPHSFNGSNILPDDEQNERKSLFALQCADTLSGNDFVSKVSVPVVLLSRRIEEPVQPEAPMAVGLKVRPDATGKAAFTFDLKLAASHKGLLRKPFGFMFYRTAMEEVLYAFYEPETVSQILKDLAALEEDPHYNKRAYEMVNLIFDPLKNLEFHSYEATPQAYGFPVPNKEGLTNEADSNTLKLEKFRAAIQGTLMPLTEQPPIFSFLKQGLQTENTLPVIRDLDGHLLSDSSPDFNPFPMVRKYGKPAEQNTTYIRFSDYHLNASSRNLYFYAAAELNNQLIPGPLSLFTGPVTVLNVVGSAAPLVNQFEVKPYASNDHGIAVTFQIAAFSPEDQVSKVRVYCTTDQAKTGSIHRMERYFDIDVEETNIAGFEITDDFSELTKAPSGQTVYYRFVGVRTIINEMEMPEEVFSNPSELLTARLIDTKTPEAPQLVYQVAENKLTWMPTTNQGTYYLFKQNSRGNWERIYTVSHPESEGLAEYTLAAPLVFEDEDGNRVYHRFKMQLQNSSGLFNLTDNELTV
ncbi:hypothetical protein [Pedobacter gandavensis]|uniref:hypothetical protein n=1 Tax=Pedobacter gandavensis TaxID=2679963 RepID=UPI002931F6BA|nr:hypothetical protein [Pedobacter gandavensis]